MSACLTRQSEALSENSYSTAEIALTVNEAAASAEEARLYALHALEILDTPPEPEFDDLVRLAATICDAPMSAVSLIDQHRQWFKASVGLEVSETSREVAFCQHTIQQPDMLVVEDASLDPRFKTNPLVTGDVGLRFYAGMPLETPDGHAVGALCVLDRTARCLTSHQHEALRILAGQVNARLELRNQRRALEQALEQALAMQARAESLEQRFQTFMDGGPFLAYIKDAEGRMLYYNDPLAVQFNVTRDELLNKTDEELWPAEQAAIYRRHDREVLTTGQPIVCHEETVDSDGASRQWRSYKFPCTEANGQRLLGGMSIDITADLLRQAELKRSQAELERANQRLQELASLDPLTQVANRRVFDDKLHLHFKEAREAKTSLSLLLLDVDRFKSHNDRFGHAHGDHVLQTLAQHLKSHIRAIDTIARYGGEEFVILLPDADQESASRMAHRLVESARDFPWPVAPVTVSIGVSTLVPAILDTEALVSCADQALYAAKCSGRNRSVCYGELPELLLQ